MDPQCGWWIVPPSPEQPLHLKAFSLFLDSKFSLKNVCCFYNRKLKMFKLSNKEAFKLDIRKYILTVDLLILPNQIPEKIFIQNHLHKTDKIISNYLSRFFFPTSKFYSSVNPQGRHYSSISSLQVSLKVRSKTKVSFTISPTVNVGARSMSIR